MTENNYSKPDTSDKLEDETWVEYWDRRRRDLHGPDCECLICDNEELLRELGKTLLPRCLKGPLG